jgi:hypothetical protein
MRRKLITLMASLFAALVVAAGTAAPALADSPHYVKGPTATVEGKSLVVSW